MSENLVFVTEGFVDLGVPLLFGLNEITLLSWEFVESLFLKSRSIMTSFGYASLVGLTSFEK